VGLQMSLSPGHQLESWESEGGAVPAPPDVCVVPMSGTANQVEWAERIRRRVSNEFDRVAASFRAVARKQDAAARAETEAIIAILEEKRAEVMRRERAGYFIHDWQETGGRVSQLIFRDSRYQAIKSNRLQRKLSIQRRPEGLIDRRV
jgi:hypothetical protein